MNYRLQRFQHLPFFNRNSAYTPPKQESMRLVLLSDSMFDGKGTVIGDGLFDGKGAVIGDGLFDGKGAVIGDGLFDGKGAVIGDERYV